MGLTITVPVAQRASDRFWSRVSKGASDSCWPWTGWKDVDGYGAIKLRHQGQGLMARAPRVSYVLHYGEIPVGQIVRHKCDNPSCVNPAHLELGTTADNMADKVKRGRLPDQRGERNPANRLTDQRVREIIAVLAEPDPPPQHRIAAMFGVSPMTVSLIRQGKIWTHIERPAVLYTARQKGTAVALSKLTDDDVREIRRLLRLGNSQATVGSQFGVSQHTISSIHLGKTWRHVA